MSTATPSPNYLLVPMNVQALVVNDLVLASTAFQNSQMNYGNLAQFLTPAPAPLDTTAKKPTKGIHLHWDLPAAFKHASDPNAADFQLVPNRWIVLRSWPGGGTQNRQLKAWIVISDLLGNSGTSPFIRPYTDSGGNAGAPTSIGANQLLAQWGGEGSPAKLFLQAVGPGDVSFAAFRPNVDNVFSFVDDGTDNQGNPLLATPGASVDLTYLVAGWFSDPASDPLSGATTAAAWAAIMGQLKWLTSVAPYAIHSAVPISGTLSVQGYGDVSAQFGSGTTVQVTGSTGNDGSYQVSTTPVYSQSTDTMTITVSPAPSAALSGGYVVPASAPSAWPVSTLTHGLVFGVTWQNSALPPRPNSTSSEVSKNVQVAIGNTSIDALAAMAVNQSQAFLTPYPILSVDRTKNSLVLSASADLSSTFPIGSLFTVRNGANEVGCFHVASTAFLTPSFTLVAQEPLTNVQAGFTVVAADLNAELLEAFQYNLLSTIDQPGGAARLDLELRKPWYAHAEGGTVWSIIATPRPQTDAAESEPLPSPDQLQWLASINFYQGNLDRETRVLRSMQDELYALWWKVQRINVGYQPGNVPDRVWQRLMPLITAALPTEASAVSAQEGVVADWQAKIDALALNPPSYVIPPSPTQPDGQTVEISTYKKPNPTALLTLKDSHMPRFYQPNDPVLLISGLNPSLDLTNPTLIGQEYLQCRFASEAVQGLTVSGTAITASQVQPLITLPNSAGLPAGVNALAQSLSVEAVFLNPDNAPLLATVAGGTTAAAIAGAIRAGQGFAGVAPDESAATPWIQSWVPLFIDWKVNWYPTVQSATTTFGWGPWWVDRGDWNFDGEDYNWQGGDVTAQGSTTTVQFPLQAVVPANKMLVIRGAGNLTMQLPAAAQLTLVPRTGPSGPFTVASTFYAAPDFTIVTNEAIPMSVTGGSITLQVQLGAGPSGVSYTGRTFLTPKATFNFRSRLQQYLDTHGQTADAQQLLEIEHLIDMIGGARYLIQGVTVSAPYSIAVPSKVDLTHLFATGGPCYIVGAATSNNGTYTVVSASYDGTTFTVIVKEPIPSPLPSFGYLVPQPQEWDFLSQSLTGFTDRLVMRVLEQNVPPSGKIGSYDVASLVDSQNTGVPDVGAGDGNSANTPPPYFFPMRGGFLALRKLYVVDRFGQSIDLLFANGNQADPSQPDNAWLTFAPVRSRWLAPSPAETVGWNSPYRMLKLPPRLPFESRLDFRFVSAPTDPTSEAPADVDIELQPAANPVCGWFLPNHLDQGVTIYDAAGEMIGEVLLRLVPSANPTIDWYPAPNSPNPINQPSDIPNPHLCDIVTALFNLPAQGGKDIRGIAFQNLLLAIDETLWAVDPLGGRSDQNLSVLIGRPLAVVRARLRLTTAGHPPYDETTRYSAPTTYQISTVSPSARTFGVTGMTVDLSARFPVGGTFSVSGSTGNDGNYHIASTSFSPAAQTFTVTVSEPIASPKADGNLVAASPTGGIESIPFAVRLGRADLFDDGLIGYFLGDDFAHFNNVHDPASYPSVGYLTPVGKNGNYVSLTPYSEVAEGEPPSTAPVSAPVPGSTFVTMLVDPRGSIHASTGILPTKDIALPGGFFENALAEMAITFRTGPLLVDPQVIRMPRPAERTGRWSWIQKNTPGANGWQEDPISEGTEQALLPGMPLVLRDGWTKLSDANLKAKLARRAGAPPNR
jgi:hypothetical protein